MCIDVCPVGALTSGAYRYKTRPWEMNHVSTVCTHCGDGCKTTLGVRSVDSGSEILRGDNRDRSGINGGFLCIKGRYAFDFANHPARLTKPLVRGANGELEEASWEQALERAGARLREIRESRGGQAIGVIGSNRTTNEENYLLQKFARTVLGTNNIDHHRTADYASFARALGRTAGGRLRCARRRRRRPFCFSATTPPSSTPCSRGICAPMYACTRPGSSSSITPRSRSSGRRRPCSASRGRATPTLFAFSPATMPHTGTAHQDSIPGSKRQAIPRGAARRAPPAHCLRLRVPRRRHRCPGRIRLGLAQRHLCLPRRLCQLPRRRRHGPSARSSARLCARQKCRSLCRGVWKRLAADSGDGSGRDVRCRGPRRAGRALRRRFESGRSLWGRPRDAQKHLYRRARDVHDRDSELSPTWCCRRPISMRRPAQ